MSQRIKYCKDRIIIEDYVLGIKTYEKHIMKMRKATDSV